MARALSVRNPAASCYGAVRRPVPRAPAPCPLTRRMQMVGAQSPTLTPRCRQAAWSISPGGELRRRETKGTARFTRRGGGARLGASSAGGVVLDPNSQPGRRAASGQTLQGTGSPGVLSWLPAHSADSCLGHRTCLTGSHPQGPWVPPGQIPVPPLKPSRAHLSRQEWGRAASPLHMLPAGASAVSTA